MNEDTKTRNEDDMNDTREFVESERGRFMLEIWETSKAPAQGYVRWAVYRDIPELQWWDKLQQSNGYCTFDVAEKVGRRELQWWAENYKPDDE